MALTKDKLLQLLDSGVLSLGGFSPFQFYIDDQGHLILEYSSAAPPPFSINDNGHLIFTF